MTRLGQFAVTIEGVGVAGGAWRFCAGVSSSFGFDAAFDTEDLYREALLGWPREISTSIDFLYGDVQVGAQSFRLARVAEVLAGLHTLDEEPVAYLEAALGRTTGTVNLDATTLAGQVIHLGREAIVLGTHTSGGVYTGCTRGALGTLAQAHGVDEGDIVACYPSPSSRSLRGRTVRLLFVPFAATSYADEELVWAGVLRRVVSPEPGVLEVSADSILQQIRGTRLFRSQWVLSSALGAPSRSPSAGYGTSTATRRAFFYAEGKGAFVAPWETRSDGTTSYAGFLTSWEPFLGTARPEFLEPGDVVREFVTTSTQQPASSASPSTNTLPLAQTPGALCLQLLTTTASGLNFPSGGTDYDLALEDLAGGVPHDLVDYESFLDWEAAYATHPVDNLHLGLEGEEDLFEVCQSILRIYGASLTVNAQGQVAVAQLADAPAYLSSKAINAADVLPGSITVDRRIEDAVERVSILWGEVPGQGANVEDSINETKRGFLPAGEGETVQINARGLATRSAAQGAGAILTKRFNRPPPLISLSVARTAGHSPGDVVRVTHPLILGDGVLGLSAALCLVIGRRERVEDSGHAVDLEFLYVGALYREVGYWAPAAVVVSWDVGTKTATVEANAYTSATRGPIRSDAEGFAAGYKVKLLDENMTLVEAGLTLASTGTNTLTFTTTPASPPAAGDLVVFDEWTVATAAQRAFAAISDTSGEIDGARSNAYGWVTG